MNPCCIDDLCISSVCSHCDQRCGEQIHILPHPPIYDGHIHLNQSVLKIQSDFISVEAPFPIHEYHFVNNNHKHDE